MRVVCDNCGASYKIPDSKLTREVNKATCRKCGNTIVIQRPVEAAPAPAPGEDGEERTLITSAAELERQARARAFAAAPVDDGSADPRPTQVSPDNSSHEATVPRDSAAMPEEEVVPPSGDRATLLQPAPEPPPPYVPTPAPSAVPSMSGARQVPSPLPPPAPPPMPPPMPSPQRVAAAYQEAPPPAPPPAPVPIAAPAPAAAPPPPPARTAHDPRMDLTFAALLAVLAVFGAVLPIGNVFVRLPVIDVVGTFFVVLGGIGAALVILTGGRGTRPAGLVLGAGGGFFVAVVFAVLHYTVMSLAGGETPEAPVKPVVAPPPAAPVVVAPPAPVTPPAPLTPPAPEAALVAPTPPEPVAPPAPVAPPEPKPTPAPKPEPEAKPKPAPERITPKPEPAATTTKSTPKPAPEAAKPSSLDTRVIDTMITSNKGVKLCYIKENKSSGTLPSNVRMKMTVQPSGTVSSARIPSGEWQGTDFDSCLSSAVKAIQFPPFDGDPLTLTYAFPNF